MSAGGVVARERAGRGGRQVQHQISMAAADVVPCHEWGMASTSAE
jgi:hypothetical protein